MLFWKTKFWAPLPRSGWVRTGGDFTVWIQGAPGFTQTQKLNGAAQVCQAAQLAHEPLNPFTVALPKEQAQCWLPARFLDPHACLQEMAKDSSIR